MLSAVMIPVFLLMAALVIDVGNWYTHKRQLQNRADAAAFAAGVEYANSWRSCVSSNAVARQSAANAIADVARQYAGDPEAADYSTGTLPALQNTEIANQANLDVVINSSDPNYNNSTDYTDGGVGVNADPCYKHTPGTDTISPGGGQWTDVRVKERNLGSIFGGIGLPLSRAGARARVEIRPAISGHRFLPLAVPNNVIEKVQVRYYNECTGAEIVSARTDSGRSADQSAFVSQGGGTLWAKADEPARATRASASTSLSRSTTPRAATTWRSARRSGSRAAPRSTSTRLRATRRGTVRRLLPSALADPHLERRQPELPAAAEGRPRDATAAARRPTGTSAGFPSARTTAGSPSRPRSSGAPRGTGTASHGQLPRHRQRRAAQSAVG